MSLVSFEYKHQARVMLIVTYSAHYGDEVYDILSSSFDDPSATIVYPYVYRILNSGSRAATEEGPGQRSETPRSSTPGPSRPASSPGTASDGASGDVRRSSPSHHTSRSVSSINGLVSPPIEEPDPDAQLLKIIGHISSETTGAMHKEGITELHQFIKAYPHKKSKVDKMLESTGPAFRKYISRALASRAAEDEERDVAVADALTSEYFLFSCANLIPYNSCRRAGIQVYAEFAIGGNF